jgi:undecaprenyl diphosphate synthase
MPEDAIEHIPKHVGYIVDGNRRWAKKHGLPAYEGHLAGYNTLKDVAQATLDHGVEYMSAYIFSTENWKRSADEVKRLMALILKVVKSDLHEFNDRNIRLRVAGTLDRVDPKVMEAIQTAEDQTAQNDGGTLIICFNYGGQREIVDAVKKVVQSGVAAEDITEALIEQNLYVPEIPPLDLVIRTSGEQRLSNFMLWRTAYSELIFSKKNWPDMTKDDVASIMKEYSRRQRRFGE